MNPIVLKKVFTEEEVLRISNIVQKELDSRPKVYHKFPRQDINVDYSAAYFSGYGRIDVKHFNLPKDIIDRLTVLVKNNLDESYENVKFDFVIYSEYNKESGGNPKLEPHFDVAKSSSVILDYQLKSNRSWGIDVESEIFTLEDNSGMLFDPLEKIHSRPIVDFEDGEFVGMLFFRFNTNKEVLEKTKDMEDRLAEAVEVYARELQRHKVIQDDKLRDGV
jgi:hypothetical protein